jgi:hypothetical protein
MLRFNLNINYIGSRTNVKNLFSNESHEKRGKALSPCAPLRESSGKA